MLHQLHCGEAEMIDVFTEVQMDQLDWLDSEAFQDLNIIAIRIKIKDIA
jgi:hypothetical protein